MCRAGLKTSKLHWLLKHARNYYFCSISRQVQYISMGTFRESCRYSAFI